MIDDDPAIAILLTAAVLLDRLVSPRPQLSRGLAGRSVAGTWLLICMVVALQGLFLALCGSGLVAACLVLAVQAVLVVASNAKRAVLGEQLLFPDFAMIRSIFNHPEFYWSAVPLWQRIAAALAACALIATLARLFVPDAAPHAAGLALCGLGVALLWVTLRRPTFRALAPGPDAAGDVDRHGLAPTLLLHWLRWRRMPDPLPCADPQRTPATLPAPDLIVIVQCESFADPVELFADPQLALPALEQARLDAWQWGRLEVSGFGAYTMRTEYGVLWGREEEALGFRRYDPFLTAIGEQSYALPRRLPGWRSLFLHPHDLRFYGRNRIMPVAGFDTLLGEADFAPPPAGAGRYVTDAAVADTILAEAAAAVAPTMLYAVTIENHGPWTPDSSEETPDLRGSYLRLARHGDAMLAQLRDGLTALGRSALLVFFGDHRPSIPGMTAPGGDRHTPYVMLRIDAAGHIIPGANRQANLTPAGLHHAVLDTVLGSPA
ncbi:LTA synthase family protein [Croceibacterium ferulae]|uniref:LTA synthase family protein n=1 Tax=Croceibacterium ferulae TaxID=1854641 RepID=UPI000EB1AC19|nr:LTA synthase family protein [Croceibacterium ferulae]